MKPVKIKKDRLNFKPKKKIKHKQPKIKQKKIFKPNYKYSYYHSNKDIKETIEKRYNILIFFVVLAVAILLIGLFVEQIVKTEHYQTELTKLTQKTVEGPTAPRGRIYDRNGKLIVDNAPSKVIFYKKPSKVTTKTEIKTAYALAEMIDISYNKITDYDYKLFWIKNNSKKANKKITDEEWQKLEERKLTIDDIQKLKLERITEEDMAKYTEKDKKAAYIYYLMNVGYSYAEKVIKNEEVSDKEYALVSENISKLNGINTKLDWNREYPYEDTFKTILGSVSTTKSGIPKELKDYYLEKGYSLNDRVGTSYIEYQYEEVLKGTKNKYLVLNDGSYKLLEEGKRGQDIVLTIDIELQKALEQILSDEVLKTKEEQNTEYYNRSFAIISNPKTGEILAMAGKQVKGEKGNYKVYDYTPGILTSPVVVGSAVKGASQIVGYNTGALQIGEKRYDNCIKIAATPIKCSWKYLGYLDDIGALAQSSNTYQFLTAINVGKGNYVYDKPLVIDEKAFAIYRNTFQEFGLGVKTEIDLPLESLGYKGKSTKPGHLLDFSIGQYDTYTPIQLNQYIGTIANKGTRIKPYILKGYFENGKVINQIQTKELNKVKTEKKYMERVQEGFKAVMSYGTGVGYINMAYNPAGKTGTSQSFIDTDGNGVVDKETITTTFVAFAPSDNPKVTFTIISPDVSHSEGITTYQSPVNKRISDAISKKYFEFYQ